MDRSFYNNWFISNWSRLTEVEKDRISCQTTAISLAEAKLDEIVDEIKQALDARLEQRSKRIKV